ncbi:thiamine phosphate synthase [Verrucomicrobiaceae bacterium N1E253]|uniref:Thiamine-phosphate synthase n=1 Tax=Oceaniferula marina TaxID=2748318 RepID=A0A851GK09_9BACT|nr:thiamine phosphate synthase [Oceaniferula marina]NWK57352.1 thiamine phosphate synthase [Oceaniferula marina]
MAWAVKDALQNARLYGILDTGYVDEPRLEAVAKDLLRGGVDILQLRAKGYDAAGVLHLLHSVAPDLPAMCRDHGVPLVINDFPDVAVEVGADALHIGQDDGSLDGVRAIVGEEMLVGRSTHSPEQAAAALDEGFDYIGFGPLFPTPTKQGRPGIGLLDIDRVEQSVGSRIPVFCIGGVKAENLELVLASGARRVVIVSALLQAADVAAATRELRLKLPA